MNAYDDEKKLTKCGALWAPGVSPRCKHKFHREGDFFSWGGNICDTPGGTTTLPASLFRSAERFDTVCDSDSKSSTRT